MTYLQILRLLERYAWNQPDVHSVVREFTDLNREEAQYSAVVIQDRDGERDLISDQDWITYTWHIGYVDRLWEEKNEINYGSHQVDGLGSYSFYSNRDDIYSQGIRVINNIIAGLRRDYDLEITTPDRINTFNQRFTAECAGVYMVIAVTVPVSDCETGGVEDMYDTLNQRFTTNGTYHFVPEGKPWDQADIVIDVHPSDPLIVSYTNNGLYQLEGEWKDAEINVNVSAGKEEVEGNVDMYFSTAAYTETLTPPEGKVFSSVLVNYDPGAGGWINETITHNYHYSWDPGSGTGYDYFNGVDIDVDVHPSTSLSETYTSNGVYTIADEFNGGQVTVSVPLPIEETLVTTLSVNGEELHFTAPSGTLYKYVEVDANIPTETLTETITSNGSFHYDPSDECTLIEGVDLSVDVHPSTSLSVSYSSNGVYPIQGEFNGGEITVAVSAQKPEESLVETITSNGSYNYTPQAGYVFDSVALSVDVHPSNSLSRSYTTNGQKTITGEFNGGTINISVHPSQKLVQTLTANGLTSLSGEWTDADITVSIPDGSFPEPDSDEIYYITYTGNVLDVFNYSDFDANFISNTYDSTRGFCVLKFDGPITKVGDNAFNNKPQLKKMRLPDSVTRIGAQSFKDSGIIEIQMDGVTRIDSAAFFNSYAQVTPLTIPEGCQTITNNAYAYCTAAAIIKIPSTVNFIGHTAFRYCSNLEMVYIYATVPPVLEDDNGTYDQFFDTDGNMTIIVPSGALSTYQNAAGWSTYASRIVTQ